MRSSFWFVPALLVVFAVGLASVLIAVDASFDLQIDKRWPLIFGAGASGARGLLAAVASSMITVAGVVFSITIVALSLASSQYTSRVLRNFMRDWVNQMVLGVFVGIFAYCLVTLRVIRGGDEGTFVPSLAVGVGLILAFVGIGYLIFFIHYISISIQASSIIATAASETVVAVDRLFPDDIGDDADENGEVEREALETHGCWLEVPALKTGYIESVDGESLVKFASANRMLLRMERGIGEFVIEGTPLLSIADREQSGCNPMVQQLNTLYVIARHRTVDQDACFGIRQIVDVALKALSPGINDTTTAVMCIDYLSAILVRLTSRRIATNQRFDGGELRVIARGPTFSSLLSEAFDQIRHNARGNVAVLTRLLEAIEVIAVRTRSERRRQLLRQQLELIHALAQETVDTPHDRRGIDVVRLRLASVL